MEVGWSKEWVTVNSIWIPIWMRQASFLTSGDFGE